MENLNFSSVCRLCLGDAVFLSILDENFETLPQKVLACVDVEVRESDKMSKMICKQCFLKVEDWHDFKKSCEISQCKLQTWVNNAVEGPPAFMNVTIKEEQPDEEIQIVDGDYMINIKTEPTEINPLNDFDYLEAPQLSPQFPVQYETTDSLLVPSFECPVSSHGIEDPPERCRVCNKMFSTMGNRIRHERILHHLELDSPRVSNSDVDSASNANSDADNEETQVENVVSSPTKDRLEPSVHQTESEFVNYFSTMSEMMKSRHCCCCNSRFGTNKALHAHLRKKMHLELYSCYFCWISFPNISQFITHRYFKAECHKRGKLLSSGEYTFKPYQNFKCNFCLFIFPNDECMRLHVETKHNNVVLPVNCPSCNCLLETLENFKEHLLTTCIYRIFCGICKQDFTTITEFDDHCPIHADNEESNSTKVLNPAFIKKATYNCRLCKNKYTNNFSLLKHLRLFHNDPSVYICKLCPDNSSSRFMLRTNLTDHMITCHKETSIIQLNEQNNFSCNECGNLFTNLNEWKEHQKSHLLKQCDECDETFDTDSLLDEHRTVHSNSKLKLKLYRCSDSNLYRTSAVSSRRNSLANQLICQICDKFFNTKKDLHDHLSLHDTMPRLEHLDTAESSGKSYDCMRCDKSYKFKFSLAKHNKNIHGETSERRARARSQPPDNVLERVDKNKIQRECLICNINFKNANALYKHNFKYHSKRIKEPLENMENGDTKDIKPFKEIKKEMKDIKPFKELLKSGTKHINICKFCGESFKSAIGLSNHIRIHTRGHTIPKRRKKKLKEPPNKELRCITCHELHDDVESLQQHILTHITEDMIPEGACSRKLYPCIHCNKICLTPPSLINHMKIHDLLAMKKAQRKCHQCGKVVANNAALANHFRLNNCKKYIKKAKIVGTTCRVCSRKFPSSHSLRAHMKYHVVRHGKDIPKKTSKDIEFSAVTIKKEVVKNDKKLSLFSCTRCKIEFPNAELLQKHIKMHLKEAKHKLALNNVKLALSNDKQNLNNTDPLPQEEPELSKQFNCDWCDEVFVSLHSLLSHKGWHKRAGSKQSLIENNSPRIKYNCKICKISFWNLTDLKKHQRKHGRKHTCVHCNKDYSFFGSYKKHLQLIHNDSYIAEESPAEAVDETVEEEIIEPVDKKPKIEKRKSSAVPRNYKCTECNLFFPDAKRLRFHVLSHANTTI